MKRYSHAAYPNQHKLEENPTGEWVRWEDVERYMDLMQRLRKEDEDRLIRAHNTIQSLRNRLNQ